MKTYKIDREVERRIRSAFILAIPMVRAIDERFWIWDFGFRIWTAAAARIESNTKVIAMLLVNASAGPSRIHGTGLMAREFIAAKALVWVLRPGFDVELTKEEFDELSPAAREQVARYVYTDMTTGKLVLCSDDAKYMNHADTPNTLTIGDQTTAIADIQPGEEITCNYFEFDAATREARTSSRRD